MDKRDERLDAKIQELLKAVGEENHEEETALVKRAIEFGRKAHDGQYRKSGEHYYIHPLRVALKATFFGLDIVTIIGALLHDVVEDTKLETLDIEKEFGKTIAALVQGLTKVRESKTLTLKRIFKIGHTDFRIILIKLLDRLDNLSDLGSLSRKKQRRISAETITVYVAVARGLGLEEIAEGLRESVFQKLYPRYYLQITETIERIYRERKVAVEQILDDIKRNLPPVLVTGITPKIVSPQEYLSQKKEVVNILECLIIKVRAPLDCYAVLGLLHTNFRSIPLKIRDYISNPRANGWMGLETSLIIRGEQVPILILTKDFYKKNRRGVITLIREGIYRASEYQSLLDLYLDMDPDKFRVEDIFRSQKEKEIQVLTPDGDVFELRHGATILDFAFMVHTEVGFKSVGGIIDNVRYPRSKILEDGMTVRVLTSDNENFKPDKSWLSFVVMPKARKELLRYFHSSSF